MEKSSEGSRGTVGCGGGLDSKMEKSAVLQGSEGPGSAEIGSNVVQRSWVEVDWGGGTVIDGAGDCVDGGSDSDPTGVIGVNDEIIGDWELIGSGSCLPRGSEDSKSAKSSSSTSGSVGTISDFLLVFEVLLFSTMFASDTPGSTNLLRDDFLRRSGPITPISASRGMNFPGLNRAEVGDTVPLRRTIGDACLDNGAWMGDIFADLGVEAGVDRVGFRLES